MKNIIYKFFVITIFLLLLFSTLLLAEEFHLRDGSIIIGKLINKTPNQWIIKNEVLGRIEIKRNQIKYQAKTIMTALAFIIPSLVRIKF